VKRVGSEESTDRCGIASSRRREESREVKGMNGEVKRAEKCREQGNGKSGEVKRIGK